MRAALRLGNNTVYDPEMQHILRRQFQELGCLLLVVPVPPEDRGTAFRGYNRIDSVFQHQHTVTYGNGERPSASPFPVYDHHNRNRQFRNLFQVMGNSFGLAAFFGPNAWISAGSIDKG